MFCMLIIYFLVAFFLRCLRTHLCLHYEGFGGELCPRERFKWMHLCGHLKLYFVLSTCGQIVQKKNRVYVLSNQEAVCKNIFYVKILPAACSVLNKTKKIWGNHIVFSKMQYCHNILPSMDLSLRLGFNLRTRSLTRTNIINVLHLHICKWLNGTTSSNVWREMSRVTQHASWNVN